MTARCCSSNKKCGIVLLSHFSCPNKMMLSLSLLFTLGIVLFWHMALCVDFKYLGLNLCLLSYQSCFEFLLFIRMNFGLFVLFRSRYCAFFVDLDLDGLDPHKHFIKPFFLINCLLDVWPELLTSFPEFV